MLSWTPRRWRADATVPAVVLLLGLCAAAGVGLLFRSSIDAQAEAEFQDNATRSATEISRRFGLPIYGLHGARGVYATLPAVDRAHFRAYVDSRAMPTEFPGVRGFGFIQRVARQDQDSFVAAQRADGAPQFSIRQLDDKGHDDLYVIKFIEPALSNAGAQGLDVGSEPRRREAALRAVDTGLPTISAAITLVQAERKTPGVLLYVPVFATGASPANAVERRAALVGLLYAPIVIGELLDAMPEVVAGHVELALFDQASGTSDAALVYQAGGAPASPATGQAVAAGGRYSTLAPITLPGRDHTLRVRSSPQFDAAVPLALPWLLFAFGALASALLAALVWLQTAGRRRAEALAQGMTADRERLAQVVRHTSNAVSITDRALRITWINEGFTRITGYPAHEALGKTPGELLGSGKADPAALRTLAQAAASGTGCRVEIQNRTRDGADYWVDTEVQPLHAADGRLVGFMEIGTDITARHLAQVRLDAALRDSQALLRAIDMHAIVSVADRAGRITDANEAFCRISGYSRDELLGQNHRIVNSGVQTGAFWVAMWRTIASGTPWRGEVCIRAKDGRLYWVDTFIAPFRDAEGAIEKYISIRTDISASKQAERALARERLALANIIEGTNAGTWEWDMDTGALHFNARWAQMIGHTVEELGDTSTQTWNSRAHPDDAAHIEALLHRHLDGESPAFECESRVRHKDGHWVWLHTRGKVFSRGQDGRARWMAGTHIDISARKQAEDALRASQSFLDRTGRIGGVGGWELDIPSQVIRWSDQTFRIHDLAPGHQPTLKEAIGYYSPEARAVILQAVEHAMATGEGYDRELPLTTATGRSIWVRAVGEVELLDGRPVRLSGAFQDISARRAMESELRRSSELLTSVLENLPCGVSVFDADLKLVAANHVFRRLLGFPDALFAGAPTRFEDLIRFNAARGEYGLGDPEAAVQAIVARARAPSVAHQFERVRPDGTPLEIRGGPMPGGGFVTTYTDISERRAAQAEVQRAGDLLRGSIDALDDAYSLFDPQDRLVLCNQRYRDLYPLAADMMVPGNSFEQIIRVGAARGQYAAAVGREEAWVAERLAQHRQPYSQLRTRLGDGRTMRIVERQMPDGHTVGFRVDVTEMVRATEAAQQASLAKSQFLANMSHEIRTPMNAILGMLALLRKTELNLRQADYAAKTEGAARSLLGLLNDILDFSKVEAGKMTLDPHPFRIDQLLRDLSVIVSANVGPKPVEVLFDIDPQLPRHLVGDAMRLQQVLINLSGNAIKFTATGEVVLSMQVLQQDAARVTLEIAVRDTGIGIAPENQARIFSGFTQAEASTTRRFGGTGLGVAISQRLVALMGGTLELDSALGRGSRFHFRLTLPLAAADETGRELPEPTPTATPMHALVVDDNPSACEVLERMGQSLGWSVDSAHSGERALELLQARGAAGLSYQAVFVDWQMPGLDGWQTSQRIRALGLHGNPPVVVMVTAHGREMLSQRSAADQALLDGFLVKPVTASMLFDAVVDGRRDHAQPHPSRLHAAPTGRRLAGMRLLVAEDNPNNQQVARELLEDEGALVQIAQHGREAVEAVAGADPPFDVVLMDLQMPVMDGFTATSRIRQDLGLLALPIVAMTANAMASDREACLAAGMNDHIGKPFDLDHLVRVLRRHAGRTDAGAATGSIADPALPAAVRQAARQAQVDIHAALQRLGGKREVYLRTLQAFITDLAAMPAQLRTHLADNQPVAASHLLHAVKGLAATLGATALSGAAAQGESQLTATAAPAAAANAVSNACAAILAAGPGLVALLQALQGAQPNGDAPGTDSAAPLNLPVDAQALHAALQAMATQLRDADMAATDAMGDIKRRFGAALGAPLASIDEAIGALDFERALQLCQGLMKEQSP